jgi:outer membrane receptor protein involved in Fe transport
LSTPEFLGTVPVYAGASAIGPPNAYTADVSAAYFARRSGTKIRSHAGNGYRKPSLYELFGTSFTGSSFTAYGDPRLKPERSVAIDGGIDQYFASDRLRLSASYFYTRLQQVIVFDSSGLINAKTDPFGRSSGYRNTGGGMARGVEISAEARPIRSTSVKMSYTYTNARDRYSEFVDGALQIPRITPNSFSMVVLQQFGRHVDASFAFLAASDYLYQLSRRTFIFPGPRQATVSAGYTRSLSERLSLRIYGRINNLSDQTYYEDGFRTPGRWATSGLTFSF